MLCCRPAPCDGGQALPLAPRAVNAGAGVLGPVQPRRHDHLVASAAGLRPLGPGQLVTDRGR